MVSWAWFYLFLFFASILTLKSTELPLSQYIDSMLEWYMYIYVW